MLFYLIVPWENYVKLTLSYKYFKIEINFARGESRVVWADKYDKHHDFKILQFPIFCKNVCREGF